MNNLKTFEEIDFTIPENKEKLDIVNRRLSQIEIKREFKKEIEFLIRINPYEDKIKWKIENRIKELENIIDKL
jgi:hypothetical protein